MTLRGFSMALVAVAATGACGDEANPLSLGQNGDRTPPAVVSVAPLDGAADVPLDTDIRVTFSEQINRATVAVASFFLTKDGESVAGLYSHEGMTAIFQPDSVLDSLSVYEATITRAVRDPAGNPLPESLTLERPIWEQYSGWHLWASLFCHHLP